MAALEFIGGRKRAGAASGTLLGGGPLATAPVSPLRKGGRSTVGPLGSKRGPRLADLLGMGEEDFAIGGPLAPPVPGDITSAAGMAALRARRRGLGSSVLTRTSEGIGAPRALLQIRSLLAGFP